MQRNTPRKTAALITFGLSGSALILYTIYSLITGFTQFNQIVLLCLSVVYCIPSLYLDYRRHGGAAW